MGVEGGATGVVGAETDEVASGDPDGGGERGVGEGPHPRLEDTGRGDGGS